MMKAMRTIKGCIAVWIFVLLTSVASNDAYAKSFCTQLETLLTSNGAQYDSGSGTYTLTQDVIADGSTDYDYLQVSSDMTIDLNGHKLEFGFYTDMDDDRNFVFKNSNLGTRAELCVALSVAKGKQWLICEGIDVTAANYYGSSRLYGSLYVKSDVTFCADFIDDLPYAESIYFEEGAKIHEDLILYYTFSSDYIPAGASLLGPDADGYYTVVKPQPEINLISAQQRYPWNGILDYTYSLTDCSSSATYKLAVGLTVSGVTKSVTNELTTVANGNYAGTINAATLFPNMVDKASKIKLQLIEVQ